MNFNVSAGVSQGYRISPTLNNIYLHDSPDTPPSIKNIIHAVDVTQIVTFRRGKENNKNSIVKEVERINTHERKWNI